MSEKTRQLMRETRGLVESLVNYIKGSTENEKVEDKVRGEEMELNGCLCLMRVLMYLLGFF